MEQGDSDLVSKYLAGDEDALEILVKRYLSSVYNLAFRLTKNEDMSEDITQEAFVKIWKNLHRYKSGESFHAWILAIARNTAIDWLRKKKNILFSEINTGNEKDDFSETIPDAEMLPDEIFARAEDAQALSKILENLSPNEREVINLHYGEDLSLVEIAKVLNKSVNTVKSLHHRAILALRKNFAPK